MSARTESVSSAMSTVGTFATSQTSPWRDPRVPCYQSGVPPRKRTPGQNRWAKRPIDHTPFGPWADVGAGLPMICHLLGQLAPPVADQAGARQVATRGA